MIRLGDSAPIGGLVPGPGPRRRPRTISSSAILFNIIFIIALFLFYKIFGEMKSPIAINICYMLFLLLILIILK